MRSKTPKIFSLFVISLSLSCSRGKSVPVETSPAPKPAVSVTPESPTAQVPARSVYNSDIEYVYGLYHASGEDDQRKIIISETNTPIPPPANDPDEDTIPGFYISHGRPFLFEEIEVTRNKIAFKTRPTDGTQFEFEGTIKQDKNPDFSESIPFIEGTLRTIKQGKVSEKEHILFAHNVIY